jgi:hypothetical protein
MVAGYVFAHGRSLDLTLGVIAAGPLAGVVFLCCVRQSPDAKAS